MGKKLAGIFFTYGLAGQPRVSDTRCMTTTPLTQTLDPETCAKIIDTIAAPIRAKIIDAFSDAVVAGHALLADDGTSPAGDRVMAQMNADMQRLGWGPEATRIMRLNVRAMGM